jgi:hypothetical protein
MLVAKLAFCFSASPQGWDSEMLVSPFLVARRSREDENGRCEGDGFCFPRLPRKPQNPRAFRRKDGAPASLKARAEGFDTTSTPTAGLRS